MFKSAQTGNLFTNLHHDLDTLAKHPPAFIIVLDEQGVILSADERAAAWLKRPANSLPGSRLLDVWGNGKSLLEEKIVHSSHLHKPTRFEIGDGEQSIVVYLYPYVERNGNLTFFLFGQEISERLKSEGQIRELAEQLERKVNERTAELEKINLRLEEEKRRAETLAHFSQLLMSSMQDYKPLLQEIAEWVARMLGDMCFIVLFSPDNTSYSVEGICHQDPDRLAGFQQALRGKSFPLTSTPIVQAVQEGEVFSARNITQQELLQIVIPEIQALMPAQGYFSVKAIPMIANEQAVGILCVAREQNPNEYTPQDIKFLKSLSSPIALAVQNARLLEERRLNQERLRGLSQQLVQTQEKQFRELARQLHDNIGQDLTAINVNVTLVRKNLPDDCPAGLAHRLEDTTKLVESTIENLRNSMAEFRPPMLDMYGLTSTLYWYAEQFHKRTAIPVRVEDRNLRKTRMPPEVEIGLFRIAQEALSNVAKHAKVQTVDIHLSEENGWVTMTVEDKGVGFSLQDYDSEKHWGLIIMRERAESLGGHFQIDSKPGAGTRVIVSLPVVEQE